MSSKDIIGIHESRPQSPAVELHMQDQISSALCHLLSTRGLYQKDQVDLTSLTQFQDKSRPTQRPYVTLDSLQKEFSLRPWIPVSKHQGDGSDAIERIMHGRPPASSLVPNTNDIPLQFYLPAFQAPCPMCDKVTTHASLAGSRDEKTNTGYPKISPKGRHQLWTIFYRCELCHKFTCGIMVKRVGDQLLLCGRSERQPPPVPATIPKDLVSIVEDAISAENEGDLFGGIYHLRTFLEHYMKTSASVPIAEQINGDELSDKYKGTLDSRMNSGFPVLGVIYTSLSAALHTRQGSREMFAKSIADIDAHLRAKKMFDEYKP